VFNSNRYVDILEMPPIETRTYVSLALAEAAARMLTVRLQFICCKTHKSFSFQPKEITPHICDVTFYVGKRIRSHDHRSIPLRDRASAAHHYQSMPISYRHLHYVFIAASRKCIVDFQLFVGRYGQVGIHDRSSYNFAITLTVKHIIT